MSGAPVQSVPTSWPYRSIHDGYLEEQVQLLTSDIGAFQGLRAVVSRGLYEVEINAAASKRHSIVGTSPRAEPWMMTMQQSAYCGLASCNLGTNSPCRRKLPSGRILSRYVVPSSLFRMFSSPAPSSRVTYVYDPSLSVWRGLLKWQPYRRS